MSTPRVLRIGREPDNDFVVDLATVSGYHARVSRSGRPGEGIIEDLGSTNGTGVGSLDRRGVRSTFFAGDTIYLGTHSVTGAQLLNALAALEAEGTQTVELKIGRESVVVGRDSSCDRVVNSPVVSSRHARITLRPDGAITVEDLNSANGTFLNGRKIDRTVTAHPGDMIALGSYSILLAVDPAVSSATVAMAASPSIPTSIAQPQPSFASDLAEAWRGAWTPAWRPALMLAFAPVLGLPTVYSSRIFDPTMLDGPGGPGADGPAQVAALASRLGTLTIVLALIGAAWTMLSEPRNRAGLRAWLACALVSAVLGLTACFLSWLPFASLSVGRLDGATSWRCLMLGAGAGLSLGIMVATVATRATIAWLILGALIASIWLFGGESRVWKQLPSWAKSAAAINPARWTFEGLMVSVADRLPVPVAEGEPPTDIAEPYFPAETERVGPRGAMMALFAMILGWGAAAAFIATTASGRPLSPASPSP